MLTERFDKTLTFILMTNGIHIVKQQNNPKKV